MTYGTKQLKNGKIRGYLIFDSGKRVTLSDAERAEFDIKARYYEATGRLKERGTGPFCNDHGCKNDAAEGDSKCPAHAELAATIE